MTKMTECDDIKKFMKHFSYLSILCVAAVCLVPSLSAQGSLENSGEGCQELMLSWESSEARASQRMIYLRELESERPDLVMELNRMAASQRMVASQTPVLERSDREAPKPPIPQIRSPLLPQDTVAVPEPRLSVLAIVAAGVVMLIARRRKESR